MNGTGHRATIIGSGMSQPVSLAVFFGVDDQPWMDGALCAQTDPEAFFPEKGGSTRGAKKTCMACDVRADCLEYALATESSHHYRFGVWGGLSAKERQKLQTTKLPTPAGDDEPDDLEEAS